MVWPKASWRKEGSTQMRIRYRPLAQAVMVWAEHKRISSALTSPPESSSVADLIERTASTREATTSQRGTFQRSPMMKPILLSLLSLLLGFGILANWNTLSAAGSTSLASPTVNAFYPGVGNGDNSPPDTTIAASPSEEIELTNTNYRVVKRGHATVGTMAALFDAKGFFLSDPQIIWDPLTERFYISMLENHGTSAPDDGLAWGFSKTPDPSSSADFCHYFNPFNYGSTSFPDRESLGDTSNFLLIGSNRYPISGTLPTGTDGADVAWISKPPAGTACPVSSAFSSGIKGIANPDGSWAYTPNPARQVDSSSTGWIAATTSYASANTLTLFEVTYNAVSKSIVIGAPKLVSVPEYSSPPSAPQDGKSRAGAAAPNIETSIFLTQVTEAYDPRAGKTVLWTAHTIAGGAGSEVRWYEIDPQSRLLEQVGTISDPNLWIFNTAIAPDRVVNGQSRAFGSSAVITVDTSSAHTFVAMQMVSVVGGGPQSGLVMVKQSVGPNVDFSCFEPNQPYCRWGDYPGDVPDPGSPLTAKHGNVWLANQWNITDINDNTPVWQTSIWNANPG